jgi:hypothetical protein
VSIFVDNCLPRVVVEAMQKLGADVRHLQHVFPNPGTKDEEWIPRVAQEGWVALTDDNRIRRQPKLRALRAEVRLRIVFLPAELSNQRLWDQATWLVKYWPKLHKEAMRLTDGACLLVKLSGKIEPLERA